MALLFAYFFPALAIASTVPEQIHLSVGGEGSTGMYISWFTQVCAYNIREGTVSFRGNVAKCSCGL